jgi:spore germination protein YaaH
MLGAMQARMLAAGLIFVIALSGCGSTSLLSRASSTPHHRTVVIPTVPAAGPGTAAASGAERARAIRALAAGDSVWIPWWQSQAATTGAIEHAGTIRVAEPFWTQIDGVSTVVDESRGQGAQLTAQLHAHGLVVIPTVTESARMAEFARLLASPADSARMIGALVRIAESRGVGGVDLDFENLTVGDPGSVAAKAIASGYPRFVARLCRVLHAAGRVCEVTVMAQGGPPSSNTASLSNYVYDYAALGKVADRIQIMAYDDHTPSGQPGPIAPLPWVQRVVSYALSKMPAGKLGLGVPAYGYDWGPAGGTSLSAPAARALALSHGARIRWDRRNQEAWFSYSQKQRVRKLVYVKRTVLRKLTRTVTTAVKRVVYVSLRRPALGVANASTSTSTATTTTAATGTAPTSTSPASVPIVTERVKRIVTVTVKRKIQRTVRRTVRKKVKRLVWAQVGHIVWFCDAQAGYAAARLAAQYKLAGITLWAGGDEDPALWSAVARLR